MQKQREATSGNFHETFGPKRPASGLFQNPVTRRDLTTPCEDDRTRPMRVNDAPEGLTIVKTSNGPGAPPAINNISTTEVAVPVQPETWRARSATTRVSCESHRVLFPSLCSCRPWGKTCAQSGGKGRSWLSFSGVDTARGSSGAWMYSRSPAS